MFFVKLNQIQQQEQKIMEKLEGRDPQDINLPEEIKKDIKLYQKLIMQHNDRALTTACVQPYKDKFSIEKISHLEFLDQFENKRYEILVSICCMNPSKIDELASEIYRNSLSIFKNPVNPAISTYLMKQLALNLIVDNVLDNIESSEFGLSI